MIDPVRREVLQVLAELSEVVPEVRRGQLMANLSYLARGMSNEAIWDMEDGAPGGGPRAHAAVAIAPRGTRLTCLPRWSPLHAGRSRRRLSVPRSARLGERLAQAVERRVAVAVEDEAGGEADD